MAPSTPNLAAERANTAAAKVANGKALHFERGANGNGAAGSGKKKKKKRGGSKSSHQSPSPAADESGGEHRRTHSAGSADGDHKHARDASLGVSSGRPQKKQRSKPTAARSRLQSAPYAIFFVLVASILLPLMMLCTTVYFSCGNDLEAMSRLVLTHKARGESTLGMMRDVLKRASSAGCTANGVVEDYLKRSSEACGGSRVGGDNKSRKKGRRPKGKRTNVSGVDEPVEPTTIRKTVCQLSSIALGSLVHYMGSDPFRTASEDTDWEEEEEEGKRGVFQRVMSKHRKKHRGHESSASEEIDRKHPLRHMLEGASIFSHHKRERKMEREGEKKKKRGTEAGGETEVDWKKWKYAMSDDYDLNSDEAGLVKELAKRVISKAPKLSVCKNSSVTDCNEGEQQIASLSEGSNLPGRPLQERLDSVAWGGIDADSTKWWGRKDTKDPKRVSAQSEGGRLLAAHLKIMKWPMSLHAKYPFRLCKDGCDSEVSILHTLEWREKYQPWCMSDSAVKFNKDGFVYHRGHSKAGPKQREAEKDPSSLAKVGHSMVWYRPGMASPADDPELYGRALINTLELATADSLVRNKGTIGRFNVVMDCKGMGSKNSPSMADVKKLFSVMQDHFPDRLGVLLAANLSGLTQMLMKMVLPFVTEDVRAKIHIIPNGEEERREMLLQFMEEDEIPDYLGGKDSYQFDSKEHYRGRCILPEEGILEYKTTMPYHN